MKNIYVVRWLNRVDGEETCGNFEFCYESEKDAKKALKADFEQTLKDVYGKWAGCDEVDHIVVHDLDEYGDFASITVEYNNFDYYNWWVDKLPLVEG